MGGKAVSGMEEGGAYPESGRLQRHSCGGKAWGALGIERRGRRVGFGGANNWIEADWGLIWEGYLLSGADGASGECDLMGFNVVLIVRIFWVWLLCWGWIPGVGAHVQDTSLLRVRVGASEVTVEWNADLATLQRSGVLKADEQGRISKGALERGARDVEEWIRKGVVFTGPEEGPGLGAARVPEWEAAQAEAGQSEWQSVHVNFRFERALRKGGKPGARFLKVSVAGLLEALGERHRVILGVIEGEHSQQAVLDRDFPAMEYQPGAVRAEGVEEKPKEASGPIHWVMLGVEHILSGYDHLLFLAMLLVAAGTWKRLWWTVTAFTAAHAVTLSLATWGVVRVSGRWVEVAIAGTIAWVALGNMRKESPGVRLVETFGFGLVHGLGFVGVMQGLRLPTEGLIGSVVLFNVGVELGQLLFIAGVLPMVLWAGRQGGEVVLRRTASWGALGVALWWIWERIWERIWG